MSLVAVAEPARTLADCVDELVVLVRNQAGGSCLWCGSRDLWVAAPHGGVPGSGDCLVVTCGDCGTELVTEQLSQTRGRWA
jgi:ribosomal protein S27E